MSPSNTTSTSRLGNNSTTAAAEANFINDSKKIDNSVSMLKL